MLWHSHHSTDNHNNESLPTRYVNPAYLGVRLNCLETKGKPVHDCKICSFSCIPTKAEAAVVCLGECDNKLTLVLHCVYHFHTCMATLSKIWFL